MKITANGIDIYYGIEGEGPWITLSHSLACNLGMWDEQVKVLSRKYKVLRYDTRGHGQSSAPPGEYTLDQLADDVKALLDALRIRRTHWVGLSMGGMIGQVFALKYPGVFQSMVLADTTSRRAPDAAKLWGDRILVARERGMDPLVESTLARWFTEPYRKSHQDVVGRIADDIRATPVLGYIGCCQAIAKIDVTDRLKEIKCPTLVIVGEQDMGTPPAMARQIHENLPGSELQIIPSAAHLSNIEQAGVFTDAVLGFLDRVNARA
ncbi:MAG: 3-oxoadipate enol-lactonase [Betaproteobacteria bacterium]|nr:3-oxoadipate enol-lactonase [Betaproteobacteria bacterium]